MSYILDALKKAEAERNAGTRPSIHAPLPYASPAGAARSRWTMPAPWVTAGVAVAVAAAIAAGAWFFIPHEQPVQLAAPVNATTAPQPPAAPAAPAAPPVATTPPAPAASEPDATPATAKPAAKKSAAKKHASVSEKPKAEKKPEPKPEPPPETTLPSLRELPDNLRQQIPPLTIGGYIYSGSKSDRSVLINNRLMHEGEEIAPGLTLERMTPNSMVLNFRGTRYRSSY